MQKWAKDLVLHNNYAYSKMYNKPKRMEVPFIALILMFESMHVNQDNARQAGHKINFFSSQATWLLKVAVHSKKLVNWKN